MIADFNPRSHEGSDCVQIYQGKPEWVFQPALPRGERHNRFIKIVVYNNFNPRSHEGSDAEGSINRIIGALFQPALPRGERHNAFPYFIGSC